MDKVLVLSNSSSLLNYEYGDIIDSFDHVVRFNNFETAGYEKYVGTKTTILARRACDDVRLHECSQLEKVLCFVTYCKWSEGMRAVARNVQQYYGGKCEIIPVSKCRQIGEKIGLDQPYKEWCSIGILTLALLTEMYERDKIRIHGFNFRETHYFKKPPRDGCFHNWEKERVFASNLGLKTLTEDI